MTRENKAGLVVASSFLALLGGVLALKWREPAPAMSVPPPPPEKRDVKAEPPARPPYPPLLPKADPTPKADSVKPEPLPGLPDMPGGVLPPPGSPLPPPVGDPLPPPGGSPLPPPVAVPPPPGGDLPPPVAAPPLPPVGDLLPLVGTPPSPPKDPPPTPKGAPPPLPPLGTEPPPPPGPLFVEDKPPAPPMPPVKVEAKEQFGPPRPPAVVIVPGGVDPTPAPTGPLEVPLPKNVPMEKDPGLAPLPMDLPPPVPKDVPAVAPLVKDPPLPKTTPAVAPLPKDPPMVKETLAPAPPVAAPPPSVREERTTSGKPIERSTFTPAGGAVLGTPRPRVSVPIADPMVRPAGAFVPTPPAPPPAALDTKALRPAVIVTPLEEAKARVGDTWEELSRRYYGDDRWAAALRTYNRDFARSGPRMRDEGTFAPGDTIFIPPADTLMNKHGGLLRTPSGVGKPSPPTASATRELR